jgi:hypothetical protein
MSRRNTISISRILFHELVKMPLIYVSSSQTADREHLFVVVVFVIVIVVAAAVVVAVSVSAAAAAAAAVVVVAAPVGFVCFRKVILFS